MLDVKLFRILTVVVLLSLSIDLIGETIPSSAIKNCKIDNAFTLNSNREIMEKTWQDVCRVLDLPPTDIPTGEFCVNPFGNPVYVQSGDLCADGSFKIPRDFGWCNEPVISCPNSSWTLSEDKQTCNRPEDSCWKNTENISELKLLAAIAYGESSVNDLYQEMPGIASATIRRRDAAHMTSVNDLIKKYKNFSNVIHDGNARYKKLMCTDSTDGFENAYEAAENAINYGTDYAHGGCFWDGRDLKSSGEHHYRYRAPQGFRFTNKNHNLYKMKEPPPYDLQGSKGGYQYVFNSTAAYGQTIFWKYSKEFINATGARQCR